MNIFGQTYINFIALARYNTYKAIQASENGNTKEALDCLYKADQYLQTQNDLGDYSNHFEYLSIPPFPKITITVDSGDNKQEGEGNNQNSDSKENNGSNNQNQSSSYSIPLDPQSILNGISTALDYASTWIQSSAQYVAESINQYNAQNNKQQTQSNLNDSANPIQSSTVENNKPIVIHPVDEPVNINMNSNEKDMKL